MVSLEQINIITFFSIFQNGFWFALGWSIFFFILNFIFSIKLAKFYRRMGPAKGGKVFPEGGVVAEGR